MLSDSMIISLRRLVTAFLLSVIVIFCLTAGAKIASEYKPEELAQRDPFLSFLTVRQLLYAAVALELIVAALIVATLRAAPLYGLALTL